MSDYELSDSDFELEGDENVRSINKPKKTVAAAKKPSKKKAAAKPKKAVRVVDDEEDDGDVAMGGAAVDNRRTSMERAQLSTKYQKKTQYEHIMLRPDTYIGSTEPVKQTMWVFEDEKMVCRPVTYVPGLYKIFDEILVNASDNKQRDPKGMKGIKVTIDAESGEISVWNDGKGIPVEVHAQHGVFIPELVFGHLMTGENFEDTQQRVVGGRNGYGAKLANIFSSKFCVETNDSKSGKRYKQEWTSNMSKKGEPAIGKSSGKDFTRITFTPDYKRFGMPGGLDEDTLALLTKRVYDTAGVTHKSVKISLNGSPLKVSTFDQYIELYLPNEEGEEQQGGESEDSDFSDGESAKKKRQKKKAASSKKLIKVHERINDRWEICIAASPDGQMQQVSFVNGICTMKGGQHVNYVADQVVAGLAPILKKKNKGGKELRPHQVKSHLWVFVNALIVNPAFDSQTKETLTTVKSKFGPSEFLPKLSDKLVKQLERTPVLDNILYWAKAKEMKELSKKAGGAKKSKLKGIDKLDDANNAGGRFSQNCTLILTEGDSAKTLAISGLSVVGRDNYGVFPLRGKLLNVRDASHSQIMKNEEVQNVMKIMGLQPGKKYTSTKELRYGHLMVMTDQDHDGSHIKGLLMNLIHYFWPGLLQVPGFLQVFVTPIVKASKGQQQVQSFYTMPDYVAWFDALAEAERKRWKVKYYKGLGTSTAKEAKEYFAAMSDHRIDMRWEGDQATDAIELAFSKKKIAERKEWLSNFEAGAHMDFAVDAMDYTSFVNKELILFSMADNVRSIPSVVDGFKPSQRKVLFACFKRKLKGDIKVAQLVGYVSEHSAYHHGEVSLASTVVGMAQTFVGSNNINLLFPSGQFGSRIMGGKDAASARYIFTRLAPLTRHLFHPQDDAVLKYMEEDGLRIEPSFYVPVIPMLLVNGTSGIGTGWSTDIPCHNPRDLIAYLRRKLIACEPTERLAPWFKGFEGEIQPEIHATKGFTGRYKIHGIFERDDDEEAVIISELPVGVWTQSYKQFLADEKAFPEGFVKDVRENHTDTKVSFTIYLSSEAYRSVGTDSKLVKTFKLETSISTSNMIAFNHKGVITRYTSAEDILDEFFEYRLQVYAERKEYLQDCLEQEWTKLDNKARFIQMVVDGDIVITKRKKAELLAELQKHGFDMIHKHQRKTQEQEDDDHDGEGGTEAALVSQKDSANTQMLAKGYDYLLSMALWTLTTERIKELLSQRDEKRSELDRLLSKKPHDLWEEDLVALEAALEKQDQDDLEEQALEERQRRGKKGNKTRVAPRPAAAAPKKTNRVPMSMPIMNAPKSKPAQKKASKATKKDDAKTEEEQEQEVEAEILSLSERLRLRMMVSPAPKAPAAVATKNAKRKKEKTPAPKKAPPKSRGNSKKKAVAVIDSSEEESELEDELSEEEAGTYAPLTPAPKPPGKKRRLKSVQKKVALDDEYSEEEEFQDDGTSDSDDDVDHGQVKQVAPRPARSRRAPAKATVYVDLSESEEEQEEDDESDFEESD